MAKTDFKSVDQYIATQPAPTQAVLNEVRRIIRQTLPEAAEVISYQIPAYKLPGGVALFFAGWKAHYSLYPASDQLIAALGDELAPHRVSKGTLRFELAAPVPAKLIERIARLRADEVAEHARAKAAAKQAKKA